MKKQSNLSRLMQYAGKHKYLTYASWGLSALSAFCALVPFIYIWRIIQQVLNTTTGFTGANQLVHYGWMAVLFAVLSVAVYIGGLMCSHLFCISCCGKYAPALYAAYCNTAAWRGGKYRERQTTQNC